MDYRIREILIKIENNLAQNLKIEVLASESNLSLSGFQHLFKKETGKSFTKYTNELRLKKACELLENTNLRIKEIRFLVSPLDESGFFREFKREFGTTPSEYRANYREKRFPYVNSRNRK